ncbi:MAG: hypothetical protein HS111_31530 [Kofleriaceae bacterium]|nr:hypothetical protein [Kofleriaceae bacterium]
MSGVAGGGVAGQAASGDLSGARPGVPDGSAEMAQGQRAARDASGLSDAEAARSRAESRASGAQASAEGQVRGATDVEGHARAQAAPVEGGVSEAEAKLRSQQREVQQFDSVGEVYDPRATVDAKISSVEAAPETATAAAKDEAIERTRGVRDAEGAAQRARQDGMDTAGKDDFYDARATVDVGDGGVSGSVDGKVKKP